MNTNTAPVKILLTADDVAARVQQLGRELSSEYTAASLTVLGVMTGGFVFCADLVRSISVPLQLGVLHARSYDGTKAGHLTVWTETLPDISGRDVLIVDDIFDTGQTLDRVVGEIQELGPKSVKTAVLLKKSVARTVNYEPDWVAFEIDNAFVVGYGLDFNGEFRQLPYVGVLDPSQTQ